jgi:vacuolar-type H+-ATPase subunit H
MKDPVQGLELINHLAAAEHALSERMDQARVDARRTIAAAEQEHGRILAEAEAKVRQMEEESRIQILQRSAAVADEARRNAEQAADGLRKTAEAKMDRAVEFLLSKVMP